MVGKRKDLKKFDECDHKQGFWWTKYSRLYFKCRHCKKAIETEIPAELRRARHAAAAKKGEGRQVELPQPRPATAASN